ncbi:MAG: hypothetical protein M1829_000873 [Trizodia sp. TS-e1964]|nr:MAG: hypothetical protein M1829_000873 [Trizodia sp. TS-e1964]
MPLQTRSQLRDKLVLEDSSCADQPTQLPPVDSQSLSRAPLAILELNSNEAIAGQEDAIAAATKTKPLAQRPRNGKKATINVESAQDLSGQVLEDGNTSPLTDAVREACESLMKPSGRDASPVAMRDSRPKTPPSPAVRLTRRRLTSTKAPDQSATDITSCTKKLAEAALNSDLNEDSFVESIQMRSPVKQSFEVPKPEPEPTAEEVEECQEDSFVQQIIFRSPSKPLSRIEDSVEAIDALEEALEKVGEALPSMNGPESPTRANQTQRVLPYQRGKAKAGPSTSLNPVVKAKAPPRHSSLRTLSTTIPKKPVKLPAKLPGKFLPTVPNMPLRRRPVSMSLAPPPQVAKSTKPLTRANFELPGATVAKQLREQREERQRLQDEQREREKQQLKEAEQRKLKEQRETRHKSAAEMASKQRAVREKRLSMLLAPKAPVAAIGAAQQRAKAKEIFERDHKEKQERENERRQKEEAARKARCDAAERGRQASRAWAEKQKLKTRA